jgi:hypothetical protein
MLLVYSRAPFKHCKRATTVFLFKANKILIEQGGRSHSYILTFLKNKANKSPLQTVLFMSRVGVIVQLI